MAVAAPMLELVLVFLRAARFCSCASEDVSCTFIANTSLAWGNLSMWDRKGILMVRAGVRAYFSFHPFDAAGSI